MKEIRVYVVNVWDSENYFHNAYVSDERFMEIAEKQGSVYSLKGFEIAYNTENIDSSSTYIRFIEVECAESINNMPSVKLNY